eukprot:10307935-Alexandrium_andersonii.AAC.1
MVRRPLFSSRISDGPRRFTPCCCVRGLPDYGLGSVQESRPRQVAAAGAAPLLRGCVPTLACA